MHPFDRGSALVLLLAWSLAAPAAAQERAWIDVNLGAASAGEDTYLETVSFPLREESATIDANYSLPVGASLDIGAGWMIRPRIGVGISIAGTAHEDVAEVSAAIPHPASSTHMRRIRQPPRWTSDGSNVPSISRRWRW